MEEAQTFFLQLREASSYFADNMIDAVSRYLSQKLQLQQLDAVPQELRSCLDDRNAVLNIVGNMKSTHTSRIEEREDRMASRSKEFIDNMIQKLSKWATEYTYMIHVLHSLLYREENERYRAKILEINSFMEMMTKALANLPEEIHQQMKIKENWDTFK